MGCRLMWFSPGMSICGVPLQAARSGERTATTLVARLQALLPGLPDLERLLIRVHYGKVGPAHSFWSRKAASLADLSE